MSQHENRYAEALNRLNRIVHSEPSMSAVLDCVVAEGREALGAESAIIDVLDDGELVVRHAAGLAEDARGRRLDPELAPHLVSAADTGKPVVIDDTRESALVDGESMARAGVRSVLAVPLLVVGDVLGFLSFNWHTSPHEWSASEIEFASQLGMAAGLALETVRSHGDLLQSERRFRATFDKAAVGMAHVAADGAFLRVNDALCEITGYGRDELTRLTFQDITHPEDLQTDLDQVAALLDGELDFYTLEKRYIRSDGALVWVSLTVSLVRSATGGEYFISVIEDITARKEAEHRLAESVALGEALNEIDTAINQTLQTDAIMAAMIDVAADVLGADTAAVTMLDGDEYVITHVHGFASDRVGQRLSPADLPHAELAMSNRTTVVIDDAPNDKRTNHEVIERFGVQSVIVVPLQRADEAYGAIFFNHSEVGHPFSNAQIDFVTKLGNHVSLAVENAALLAAEHRVAETLQNALLVMPDSVEGIEFAELYRSSSALSKVGGDFYDLFELDDCRAGIVVGDVSGKGLEAAALNARARASLRAELSAGDRTPGEVLRRVNEMLYRETDTETFFTVFLGVLNRESGELRFASGGHTTTALVKPDGTVERLESTGPIVGAFDDLTYADGSTVLEPGDVLFAYTDGLTEARCVDGLYGEARLFSELAASAGSSPATVVAHVIEVAEAHSSGLYDDIAMLAVRRAEPRA